MSDPYKYTRRRINLETGLVGSNWVNGKSMSDSEQIARLRSDLGDSDHRFANDHKTPAKLGIYAAERGIVVTDFGKHSQRWISLFHEGVQAVRSQRRKSQPLT